MQVIRLVLNILWLILAGFWMAVGYLVAAVICFILIITIPFGIAALRNAAYVLWPFGRTTVDKPGAGAGSLIGNIIWFVVAGWWLALGHLLTSIPLFISIIGIPFGWANLKLIPLALFPLGKDIVDSDQAFAPNYRYSS
ncbi:YccF domain-containing protein [Nocardia cyriacigeorgica]|uniref:YccF domain-containing protein n=2 Tax=Nocardia cyriacigeorgica TaxID=135487 RepID=A0A6P1CMA7_9NOCA|nr:YccF domain-containing protein [Nocardia cyriacigeorgica]MBF6083839.1 YccF domain-containing protein [Nocardia cyriacigeorgica]NEW33042.1 YccF domain-containing protein [Nocardia cyriacigeorgica]CCF61469.1 putative membrane protein [Nocardia cyriacigeorgica GUH-2]